MGARPLELALDPELVARLVPIARLRETRGRRATGLEALDRLLEGGWPRAALSEISGQRSSGRTAVMRAALAATLDVGEAAALVDATGALDARRASAAGLELPALLWIRCSPRQALKAADLVVAAGGFGLVALDLCDAQLRVPDAAWARLRHGARAQGTTVLVATSARRLGSFAAAAIELCAGAPRFLDAGPALFAGLESSVRWARAPATSAGTETAPCASLVFTSRS